MASNSTTYAGLLKKLFIDNKKLEEMCEIMSPFYGAVKKDTNFYAKTAGIPVQYGRTNRVSHKASDGLSALTGTSLTEQFVITQATLWASALMERQAILQSSKQEGGFRKMLEFEVGDTIKRVGRVLASELLSGGSGSAGKVGEIDGTSLTLADVNSVVNFEVGDVVALSSVDGSGSLRDSGDTVTISAVNRDTGVLTGSTAWATTITGAAAGDYIFHKGNHASGIKGVGAWIPATAPSGTDLFSVDRSLDPVRLAGHRFDASSSSLPLEDIILDAEARVRRDGGMPNVAYMSPARFADLQKSLSTLIRGEMKSASGRYGYKSIVISGAADINVVPDPFVSNDTVFLLEQDTWELMSMGNAPHIVTESGELNRVIGADQFQVDVAFYGNLVCYNPGANARITLPSAS